MVVSFPAERSRIRATAAVGCGAAGTAVTPSMFPSPSACIHAQENLGDPAIRASVSQS